MASPASISTRPGNRNTNEGAGTHSPPVAAGEAVAIIQRDDFLLELGEALGGQIAMRPVETLDSALEHLAASRRPQILLIDARDATDLPADVARVHTQAPHVPIVVFAPSQSERTVAASLKNSKVFAVLPVPVDSRKTAAVLNGALGDAVSKRSASRTAERPADMRASLAPPLAAEPAHSSDTPVLTTHVDDEPPRRRFRLVLTALVAGAVAAAGATWYLVRARAHPGAPKTVLTASASGTSQHPRAAGRANLAPPATTVSAAHSSASAPAAAGTVGSLLEKARLAMRDGHYLPPSKGSAFTYYLEALKADPASGEAHEGLAQLEGLATSRFNAAMSAGNYNAAATALASLKLASPGNAHVEGLESRLLQREIPNALNAGHYIQAASLIGQAQQSHAASAEQLRAWHAQLASGRGAARVARLAGRIEQAIQAGHLRSPSAASAQSYLGQLESLAPGSAAARAGAHELTDAYLSRARRSALAGDSSSADKWLAAARATGMTRADFDAYQRSLANARTAHAAQEASRFAQLASDRIQAGKLISPAHDSADYYLRRLQSVHGDPNAIHSIAGELAAGLIEQATAAARAGRLSAMSADIAAARHWGADPALIAAVQQIVKGPAHAGTRAASGTPRIPPGYVPRRTHYVEPEYPQAALEAHVSGVVTVEFTVDFDGRPRNVRVVKAQPRGVFDDAAITAVSQWRFAPPIIDNVPMQIPTRTVIRFVAPQ